MMYCLFLMSKPTFCSAIWTLTGLFFPQEFCKITRAPTEKNTVPFAVMQSPVFIIIVIFLFSYSEKMYPKSGMITSRQIQTNTVTDINLSLNQRENQVLKSQFNSLHCSETVNKSSFSPVIVVCHGLTVGQIMSQYFIVQRPISWSKAREFCQKHFVDLAVLNKQEQYFTLLNATSTKRASFWIGLQRQSIASDWKWVDEGDLSYEHWYRNNYEGHCASLEAMLKTGKKLLARYCDEPHMFVCQGEL